MPQSAPAAPFLFSIGSEIIGSNTSPAEELSERRGGRTMLRAHKIMLSVITPLRRMVALVLLLAMAAVAAPGAAHAEKRIALVIGNGAYQAGGLATPANDAGLIAQTLQAAGFDVVGARDLDQDSLRRAFRDFV